MSRFTGSTFKKARRYGFSIREDGKEFSKGKKRTTAPGQHGARRVKLSEYGLQLHEKQKLRFMYGVTERQFRNTYVKAKKENEVIGTAFLQRLESRLDNIVYRMGLSMTRQGARQIVAHGHILVNGKKLDIPSHILTVGDKIAVREKSAKNTKMKEALAANISTVKFVEFDKTKMSGKFKALPERSELNQEINEALIVEWYNRLIK